MRKVVYAFIDVLVMLMLLAMIIGCATGVVALWWLFVHTVHSAF